MQELLTQPDVEQEEWDEVSFDDLASEAEPFEVRLAPAIETAELARAESDPHIVVEETLAAAARQARQAPGARRRENRGFGVALLLALLTHLAIGAVCLAIVIAFRLVLPRVHFSRGQGSIDTGLLADIAKDGATDQSSLPGPALPAPQVTRNQAVPNAPSSLDSLPEPVSDPARTLASFTSSEKDPDPIILGVAPDTGGPPAWRPNFPKVSSPAPAPQPAGGSASASAVPTPNPAAAAERHVLVPPKGIGHGGTAWGDAGSGFDSRGLPIPEYPQESKRRHEEGTVNIEVVVKADGTVGLVRLSQTSGFPRLDQAAIEATRRATFSPATDNGTPIPIAVVIPFRFILR